MDLLAPMIAGAAGAFVKTLADKGVAWLIELVGAHSPAVQEQAQRNAQNFLVRLAKRVEILEAELPAAQRTVFEQALGHPSTSLLMQKAFVSAAATENDDRHELLSELIAQRLTAEADDMIALAGSAACDVVNALSSRQIRLLGVMARLFDIRPSSQSQPNSQVEYDEFLLSWCGAFDILSEGLEKAVSLDFRHLEGLSCIVRGIGSYDVIKLLSSPLSPSQFQTSMDKLESTAWWPVFKHVWDIGIKHSHLTSVGTLIGTLYHDSALKARTEICWEE